MEAKATRQVPAKIHVSSVLCSAAQYCLATRIVAIRSNREVLSSLEGIINISSDVSCISIYVNMQEWINI
jgi:hypothetical protein